MKTFLLIIMILSGILFVGSVLLMSPKGGLGAGVAGMSGSGEYGSKKSVENTLKRTAIITSILFLVAVTWYPYA